MKYLLTIAFAITVCAVIADDIKPEPKGIESSRVQNAYKTYKAELAKAQEIVQKADAAYTASLKQAQSEAMKAGNTADYEAIKAYSNGEDIDSKVEVVKEKSKKRPLLVIKSAKFGKGSTWVDVTEEMKKLIIDNSLNTICGDLKIRDPLVGVLKDLKLEYTLNGELISETIVGGTEIKINLKETK